MSLWLDIARLASGVNFVLLLALGAIWLRNYRQVRSKHALGLLVFAGFLLVENALWVYVYNWDATMRGWFYSGAPLAQQAMMSFCVLETAALAFLGWITWD